MLKLKFFCVFLIISMFYMNLISCDKKKKEKNIYTKEANEGDFKHGDHKKTDEEDEIIDEEELQQSDAKKKKPKDEETKKEADVDTPKATEDKPKIDAEKAKEILKVVKQLGTQLHNLYESSFNTLGNAITEIDGTFLNVTDQGVKATEKVAEEIGKDLSEVKETITTVIHEARTEFGEYRKILAEKQKELKETDKTALEITPDLDAKAIVKLISEEIQKLMVGGNQITEVMNELPMKLGLVTDKTIVKLNEKLTALEKSLNVDLSPVKEVCKKSLDEISTTVSLGLKQTSAMLAMTLNTMLGLVATLQSSVQ